MNSPIFASQKYTCPVHGEVIDYIRVKQNGPHDGDYCQVCWVEWLVTVSKKLTPIAGEPAPTPATRPHVVCLCGSGRFKQAFEDAEFNETLAGRIVLTIGCNAHDVARSSELAHHKPMLDQLHLRKIDIADDVLVLNVDGYIGDSTRREIEYARSIGKPIRWLTGEPAREEPK